MSITNVKNPVMETVTVNRNQAEHRATWMALIFDEMRKAGVSNAEEIVRKAIKRTGNIHGAIHYSKCADPTDCAEFLDVFLGTEDSVATQTFAMSDLKADRDNLNVVFHYCPLVDAWQKLGFNDEDIALLCDMAMDGDRGIAEKMGLSLELTDTIAKGCETCLLHFHK